MNHQGDEFVPSGVEINQDNVKCILMDGYEYCFNRMVVDAQRWKCSNKSCYAYFRILGNQLLPGVMAHTHPRQGEASSEDANNQAKREASPEPKVQSPVKQKTARPGVKRAYPSKAKNDEFCSLWDLPDVSTSAGGRKVKLPSRKTAKRSRTNKSAVASPPDSGFVSDQDSAFQLGEVLSGTASPLQSPPPPKIPELSEFGPPPTARLGGKRAFPSKAKNDQSRSLRGLPKPSSSAVAGKVKLPSGKTVMRRSPMNPVASPLDSGFVSDQDSAFQLAALISGTASPLMSPAPPRSPKLSEIGPPPTPPLSQHSSQLDSGPSSPLPQIIDLVEAKYRLPSFSPDFGLHFMEPATNSNSPFEEPQIILAAKSSSYSHPSTSSKPRFSRNSEKLSKLAKYREYENAMMLLNNEKFGCAVTSLLSDLPSKTAEDIRYEIATLLYDAVEEHKNGP